MNLNTLGKLLGVTKLTANCSMCKRRADFSVIRTNAGLPKQYHQSGTRTITYCKEHFKLDTEAVELWQSF